MKTQLLNSIIHRQRLLFSIRFLISISMAIVMLVVQPVRADSNAKVALSTILNSDGTIRVGACGSFDTYGYTLVNTSNGQPAFQPTLNTQQVLGAQGSGDEHWSGPSGMTGTNGNVFALALDSNGNLYIGGSFTMAGSILANNIAKWDGINWTALGVGIRGKVVALSVSSNGTVYAGGYFTTAGGVVANNVAKWDGTSWTGLGSGINGNPILNRCIKSLALDGNDNLYAGGDFTTAGGISANNIAKWNGTTWTALGAGLTGTSIACVDAVAIDNNGILYAGGGFYLTGGTSVNSIAKWEGTAWTSLGTGISGNVYALATDGSGNVYVGGSFDIAGGIPAKNIAKWNGTTWTALGTGINGTSPFNKSVWALTVDVNNNVYAGGGFNTAGGIAVNNIAKWNGTSWAALGTGVNDSPNTVNSTISALIAGTALYAGGSFGTAGGAVVNAVARWEPNASRWSRLGPEGQSVNGDIYTMAVDNSGNLYVGGNFTTAGNIVANNIAKWNGTSWTALGSGILGIDNGTLSAAEAIITSLAVDGSGNVYASGLFTTAGGVAANNGVVKWNGTAWVTLPGLLGIASVLNVDGSGNVYAGGYFRISTSTEGVQVAKWTGTTWTALSSGFNNRVNALTVDGSGNVYAGGSFTTAGSGAANRIAKWTGTTWVALGAGVDNEVDALAIDGNGNLYAGGSFTMAGGILSRGIARWNGVAWTDVLGTGTNGRVTTLGLDRSGNVYVGGIFGTAGGVAVSNIAKCNGTAWTSLGTGVNGSVRSLALTTTGFYAIGSFTAVGDGSKLINHLAYYSYTASPLGNVISRPEVVIKLYPNPAHKVVTVEFSVINSTRYATLTLVDALGQAVRSQSTQFLTTTDIKAEMSLAGLAPGFYWLRIQAGDKQVNRALIVE